MFEKSLIFFYQQSGRVRDAHGNEPEIGLQWSLREAQKQQGRSRAGGSKRKQPDQIKDRQIKGPTC